MRTLLFFPAGLELVAIAPLVVGVTADNDSLQVASYALGMPITFCARRQFRALPDLDR
jgi:hypothetical protein